MASSAPRASVPRLKLSVSEKTKLFQLILANRVYEKGGSSLSDSCGTIREAMKEWIEKDLTAPYQTRADRERRSVKFNLLSDDRIKDSFKKGLQKHMEKINFAEETAGEDENVINEEDAAHQVEWLGMDEEWGASLSEKMIECHKAAINLDRAIQAMYVSSQQTAAAVCGSAGICAHEAR